MKDIPREEDFEKAGEVLSKLVDGLEENEIDGMWMYSIFLFDLSIMSWHCDATTILTGPPFADF